MAGPGKHIFEDDDVGLTHHLVHLRNGEVHSFDGAHSNPEDVAEAEKIIRACGLHKEGDTYRMAVIHPVPDLDPPINEEAAANVKHMMEVTGRCE